MTFHPVALAALISLAAVLPCQAGVVRGTVVEASSGHPIGNARAYTFLPGQANTVQAQAVTDSTGIFWLTNVPPGTITVRVQAPWHDPWAGTVSMGSESDTERVDAKLNRVPIPGSVSGKVTFEGGTKPGRHAHMRVRGSEVEATADDDGLFAAYGVPVGQQTLEFVALGYEMVSMPVMSEEGRNLVVHPDLGHSLAAGGSGPKPSVPSSVSDTVGCIRFGVRDSSKTTRAMSSLAMRHVTVEILSGDRVVRKLMDWATMPGYYTVVWDGRDDTGKPVPAGTYRYRAQADQDPAFEGQFVKK
jgi:hypothetical protein